jgi:hypothetical protein
MARIIKWKDEEEVTKNLLQRFKSAQQARRDFEKQWEINERVILNGSGEHLDPTLNLTSSLFDDDSPDSNGQRIGVNKNLKNLRLIHSQMSANPPSVIPRPNTPDNDDRRKADAADRLVRHGMRKYKFPEQFDRLTFNALLYGSGFIKGVQDADSGEILDVEDDGTLVMEGDFKLTVPNVWNVFPDGDVTCWEDVRYVFEGFHLPYEQALYMFPDKEELLKKYRQEGNTTAPETNRNAREAQMQHKSDVVYVLQYWEKGLPQNGMQGRFCWCTTQGEPLTKIGPNPHSFRRPLSRLDVEFQKRGETVVRPSRAYLPYTLLTDIDLPNTYWGGSVLYYSANLQDKMNHLDSVTLESIEAHGVPRMVLPEGTEIADDSITNSPLDIISITGNQPPYFMSGMQMPTDLMKFREQMSMGIDDMWGVNESMFGQQSREQSGFSMQYATNQGNMIRRRLFNKYIAVVEECYKSFLNIVRENWDEARTIHVIGKEKAFEAIDISGADIDGGFDLIVEYGASLSLDPITRRQEIMTLMPVFEKAGMPPRTVLQMLKLNELDGMFDRITLANDRQREIFEEMTASKKYIAPSKIQDHVNMLAYAYDYVMTAEFKYLDDTSKSLIERHIEEREKLAQPPPEQAPAAPGGMLGGVLGALAGGGGTSGTGGA